MSEIPVAPFGIEEILDILPHRYPMLLLDRVLELDPGKRVVAIKNVTHNEPFFQGHFPGFPIMPGVLVIEAIAQAAGIAVMEEVAAQANLISVFAGIERARFRRPVVPGDQLRIEVEVLRRRSTHVRFAGKALVEGKVAAEVTCHSAMIPRQK